MVEHRGLAVLLPYMEARAYRGRLVSTAKGPLARTVCAGGASGWHGGSAADAGTADDAPGSLGTRARREYDEHAPRMERRRCQLCATDTQE